MADEKQPDPTYWHGEAKGSDLHILFLFVLMRALSQDSDPAESFEHLCLSACQVSLGYQKHLLNLLTQ